MLTVSAHQGSLPTMKSQAGYREKNIHNTHVCQSPYIQNISPAESTSTMCLSQNIWHFIVEFYELFEQNYYC